MPLRNQKAKSAPPSAKKALTDSSIRNAKPAADLQKLSAGGGLWLEIRPTGAKLWRYRYRIAGKENTFAAGEYAQARAGETKEQAEQRRAAGRLTLAEARVERETWRALVKQGVHPAHHRQAKRLTTLAENANTFEAVALEWIAKKKPGWRPYYLRQVERFLASDVFPYIGSIPIRSVTAAHLLGIVQRAEARGAPSVALLLRQWSSAIFRYAVSTLRADTDPASALRGAIHRPKTEHKIPLSRTQIAELLAAVDSYGGHPTTVFAFRLMLLTFVRTIELRAATWAEFDFERAEWRIPAERMKKGEPHIVPLSRQALELLRKLHSYTGGSPLLFPNVRNPKNYMSGTTLNRALERMGFNGEGTIDFSGHGFRATASTILNEMGYRDAVIERQLSHKERNKVRASYNQAEYLEERRAMMQQWADMVDEWASAGDKVVPIKKAAA